MQKFKVVKLPFDNKVAEKLNVPPPKQGSGARRVVRNVRAHPHNVYSAPQRKFAFVQKG